MGMDKVLKMIEEQQKGHKEHEPLFTIGEQLKDIARHEPASAELLEKDLAVQEMSLAAAEKKLKEYADKNHGSVKCFCITPAVADRILRDFYGLPKAGEAPAAPAPEEGYIDLSSFL